MKTNYSIIHDELLTWEGITTRPGRFGAVAFFVGSREVGHLHGSHHADLPFPKKVRDELVRDGRAVPHDFLPETGWVSYPMTGEGTAQGALELFHLNYDLITRKQSFPETVIEG
jgi:hypothetical protein